MSVRVMTAVWALALPDSEKIVLLALADCANDEGHCWPGMKSLVAKCSKAERTIQGAIQKLVDGGHLTRREVMGKGCNYTVHPRIDCAPAETAPRSDSGAPPQASRDTPAAAAGKPSKKHQEPSFLKGIGLPAGFPAEPYMALVRARLSLRPKVHFTEDAARGIVRKCLKLEKLGYDIAKLLWKAVDQGWRTVFEHEDCRAIAANANRPLTNDELQNAIRFHRDTGDEAKATECEAELKKRLAA
jgi:hypothetical protein